MKSEDGTCWLPDAFGPGVANLVDGPVAAFSSFFTKTLLFKIVKICRCEFSFYLVDSYVISIFPMLLDLLDCTPSEKLQEKYFFTPSALHYAPVILRYGRRKKKLEVCRTCKLLSQ